jgi:hypothetical protein
MKKLTMTFAGILIGGLSVSVFGACTDTDL